MNSVDSPLWVIENVRNTRTADRERELGIPVGPMNDRTKFKSTAHMVSGFIDFIAQGKQVDWLRTRQKSDVL